VLYHNKANHTPKLRDYPVLFLLIFFAAELLASELNLNLHPSDIEPAVQLHEYKNRVTEEYRINGNLYMIKITPMAGPSYYLVDDSGTGDMELRRGPAGRDFKIPRWTLLTW